jgi:hypothetical protein
MQAQPAAVRASRKDGILSELLDVRHAVFIMYSPTRRARPPRTDLGCPRKADRSTRDVPISSGAAY